jgi:hypothetical protein
MKPTIKDLNCENCNVNKNMLSRYGMNCEVCGNIDPNTINKTGCASHPMALQVLAGPVIEELEKTIKTNSRWPKLEPYYQGVNAMCENTIKLLKEGVKE